MDCSHDWKHLSRPETGKSIKWCKLCGTLQTTLFSDIREPYTTTEEPKQKTKND